MHCLQGSSKRKKHRFFLVPICCQHASFRHLRLQAATSGTKWHMPIATISAKSCEQPVLALRRHFCAPHHALRKQGTCSVWRVGRGTPLPLHASSQHARHANLCAQHAVLHVQHTRMQRLQQGRIVADGKQPQATLARLLLQRTPDLHLGDGVVHGGEFVGHQHAQLRNQGTHDGDTLHLAAR